MLKMLFVYHRPCTMVWCLPKVLSRSKRVVVKKFQQKWEEVRRKIKIFFFCLCPQCFFMEDCFTVSCTLIKLTCCACLSFKVTFLSLSLDAPETAPSKSKRHLLEHVNISLFRCVTQEVDVWSTVKSTFRLPCRVGNSFDQLACECCAI